MASPSQFVIRARGATLEPSLRDTTDWKQVALIIAAGVIGAAQIGKAAIAIPLLRDELGLSLFAVSWIIGAYAVLGAFGGLAAALAVSHLPLRQTVIAGLGLIALGNIIGAAAASALPLIAGRIVEGVGFLGLVIAGPSLLRNMPLGRNQEIVFACWAAYIPVGTAIMLLLGPRILQFGWHTLWLVNAALALAHGALMLLLRPAETVPARAAAQPPRAALIDFFGSSGPLLLAAAFALYAIQYYALATFLPILLVDRMGLSLDTAGLITALAVLANGAGNISAGVILRLGAPLWRITGTVFVAVGLTGFGVFGAGLPTLLVAGAATAGLAVTALLPASIIASAPKLSGTTQRLALTLGLLQQAAAIGQFVGPVILAAWVERFGWSGAAYLLLLIALLGLAIVVRLRRLAPS